MQVSSLVVDGTTYALETAGAKPLAQSNRVDLSIENRVIIDATTGESCPILLVWDEASQVWINLGKVIHDASGVDKLMTQRIKFEGVWTRFRIAEVEPEVTYLKNVRLVLSLKNGRQVEVPANSFDEVIPAYSFTEVAFGFPSGISASDVATSELVITGYYDRYSALLAADAEVQRR
jgi:hypothetical protein